MTESIIKTQNEIQECKDRLIELRNKLLDNYYEYLETKDIKKNDIVYVSRSYSGTIEKGIFDRLEYSYGSVKPVVKKINKDGTKHKTAIIYIYSVEEMQK